MKKWSVVLVFLTVLFSVFNMALADGQHLFSGGFPSAVVDDLRYVLSGGDSYYQQNIMKAGANQWNGISSNVAVSLNSSGAKMSIIKSTTTINGLFGETYAFTDRWVRDLEGDDIWYVVDIYLFDNQMTNWGLSDNQKKAVSTHETGHALSLQHTNNIGTNEVMDQGIPVALSPTDIDEDHLELKWGY